MNAVIDQDRLKRIIAYGNFGGVETTDQYYVHYDFGHVKISLRLESISLDFWVTTDHAYVPVSLALPAQMNAYFSKSIRWVFEKLLAEYPAVIRN